MSYLSHPLIVPDTVEERAYQKKMAEESLREDTLIIIPTGLGKTVIAMIVAANILEKGKKVLILAPTKPLVEQHYESYSSFMRNVKIGMMTGQSPPSSRKNIIDSNDLIVSTPQVVDNDLCNEVYSLRDFGLIVFDEAHRAVGGYAYVNIASYNHSALVLGMTASPGSDMNKILEVCRNLGITRADMRTDDDPDVSPYIHNTFVRQETVDMPKDLLNVISVLNKLEDGYVRELVNMGFMDPGWPASMKHLLTVGESLQRRLARGEKTAMVFRGLVAQSAAVKLLHAVALAETQGMTPLRNYMARIEEDAKTAKGGKASKDIVNQPAYKELWKIMKETRVEHPKISRLMSLVSQEIHGNPGSKVMVFSQYRETCDILVGVLSRIPDVNVTKLIGQSKGGLKQKEQISLLDDFRSGKYNVIVSTSVGEEGLDIASTDLVIFYEPVPSEIRTIQRRGRTGRKNEGEVVVMIAKSTRDEVYERTSQKKESMMSDNLGKLNHDLRLMTSERRERQTRLGEY